MQGSSISQKRRRGVASLVDDHAAYRKFGDTKTRDAINEYTLPRGLLHYAATQRD